MSTILKAVSISKKYNPKSSQTELLPTSIKIEKGVIYVIKGKSGSGKSTLLNILGGMEKPTTGIVYSGQMSFYDLSDKLQSKIRSEKYGFVFQSFNLIPELTVYENIELPNQFNRNLKIDKTDILELSNELDIRHLLEKETYKLSGGEQQRVAIARALITNPEIIFADEPTGNLDVTNSKIIADLLTNVVLNRNSTLLLVTHEEYLIEHEHIKINLHNGEIKMGE